jgi:hypothetical protein
MSLRDAIHILIQSPIYFRLTLPQRLELVKEYCEAMNRLCISLRN